LLITTKINYKISVISIQLAISQEVNRMKHIFNYK